MSEEILDTLKKDLEVAKKTKDLTLANISSIVKEATSKIVQELKFNKDMSIDLANDVMQTTTRTLKELGEDTKENIKASSEAVIDGVVETLKEQYEDKSQKMEEVYKALSHEVKKDMSAAIDNAKEVGELSFDILKKAVDGAIKGAKEALEDKKK
jgi:NADH dehydrogenase/NADH:ubiquinone oxidoreductase subunit G